MKAHDLDTLYQLKRKMYLGIIPLVTAAFLLFWISHDHGSEFDDRALPGLILLLIVDFLVVYKFVRLIPYFEVLTLGIFSLYHVSKFFIYVHIDHTPDFYMLWSALFYVYIFIALHNNKGLIFSLTIYLITLLMLWFFYEHNFEESL